MKFANELIPARLIKRYKRFLADVELEDGTITTAHCANPGAMLGLKEPDSTVWLSPANNPKRKLQYSWELVELVEPKKGQAKNYVGINTSHPNKLVEEAIINGTIKELIGYESLKREVKYGQNSRIDILLGGISEAEPLKDLCYVEVKNVHLLREPGLAEFPDSVTARGAKHLVELANIVKEGHRAVMVYAIQRSDVKSFSLAEDIDPAYAAAFREAKKAGVEAIAYSAKLSPKEISLTKSIPIIFE